MAETQQTYDLIASEFARQNSVAAAEVADRLDELAASLPAGSVVADIGCGPGRDVTMLRARGLQVAGIDLSLGQLRASDVPGLVQADMRHLPLQAGSVHGIWCWAALVHLPREAVPQALAEFARIVGSGGSLSMSIAEGDGEGFEVATPYGSDRRRWFTRYREPELTALLTAAGFSIRNIRRHRAYRDWLSVHATREPAGGNGLQRQPPVRHRPPPGPCPTTVASAQNDASGTALHPARSHQDRRLRARLSTAARTVGNPARGRAGGGRIFMHRQR